MIPDTLQNALTHHRAGRLDEAARLYEEILRIDPSHADALHLSGVIDHQQGRHRRAERRISRAIATNPDAPSYYSNLGSVYRALGEIDKAVTTCREAVRMSVDYADAHNNLGNAFVDQGKFDEAVASFRRALQIEPDNCKTLLNLGNALRHAGEPDEAAACYRRALELQPRFAAALRRLGGMLHDQGKLAEAETYYRRALEVNPDDTQILNSLGHLLECRGDHAEAETCYRRAVRITPDYIAALNNLGNVLLRRRELGEAENCYRRAREVDPNRAYCHNGLGIVFQQRKMPQKALEHYRRALEIEPDNVDALANLAELSEKLNRLEEAASFSAKCLRLAPDHVLANLVAATCDSRGGRLQEAIERLERVRGCVPPHSTLAKDVAFRLGSLHDRNGNAAEAFTRWVEANHLAMLEFGREAVARRQQYAQTVRTFGNVFTRSWVESWSPTPPLPPAESPAFLVGFPRSGTTLLQVVLASHPAIQTVGEKPTVEVLEKGVHRLPGEHPQAMADLAPATIESLRDEYFRAVDQFIRRRPGTIVVDKQPMHLVAVGLILRFFPGAKFIVAIRHPCDVCLSCFMQNFRLNNAMANFLTLEDTATLYDSAMRLWRQYVEILPHAYCVVKYEHLVEHFQRETRRLLEFLGIPWDDCVRQYARHARRANPIHTPSYHQVVEPIYRRAVGRWRRYAKQLAPVMDLLQPHIEYFGYDF